MQGGESLLDRDRVWKRGMESNYREELKMCNCPSDERGKS